MATVNPIPAVTSNIQAATTAGNGASAINGAIDKNTLAGNFNTFLQLLTTQLKNQNPLDPLDTNQFTQQLVQFAQVEQQIRQNSARRSAPRGYPAARLRRSPMAARSGRSMCRSR